MPRIIDGSTGENFDARSANFQTNVWTHLVATYEKAANLSRLFLNGDELEITNFNGPDIPNDSVPARLGMRYDGTASFQGSLDGVRIYNRALNDAEAKALFRLND